MDNFSAIFLIRLICGILLLFCLLIANAEEKQIALVCDGSESERFVKAPTGASRLDPHTLQVTLASGTKLLKDEAPFDEPLDGVKWEYCDYNSSVKFHLIFKQDEDAFTGVLLSETTGNVLEAGQSVLFSLDGKKYFAERQYNGMDGAAWYIFTIDGNLEWKGSSNTDKLWNPNWNAAGLLEAKLSCSSDVNDPNAQYKIVTLKKVNGKWTWLPPLDFSNENSHN